MENVEEPRKYLMCTVDANMLREYFPVYQCRHFSRETPISREINDRKTRKTRIWREEEGQHYKNSVNPVS